MRRVIVTGASGFIGSFLCEHLSSRGYNVYGLYTNEKAPNLILIRGFATLLKCDVREKLMLTQVIKDIKPHYIVHLAAQSYPKLSWKFPDLTFQTNVVGTLNLFHALIELKMDSKIIVFGSASEYAKQVSFEPIDEEYPLKPSSPYASSKIAQDHLSELYTLAYNLRIIRVRPFFIIGPRKLYDASSDFSYKIISAGKKGKIIVGDLTSVRDFLDVRDACNAIEIIMLKGSTGDVYNICSGIGVTMKDILDYLIIISKYETIYVIKKEKGRIINDNIRIGNPKKLKDLGWNKKIELRESLHDIYRFWMSN